MVQCVKIENCICFEDDKMKDTGIIVGLTLMFLTFVSGCMGGGDKIGDILSKTEQYDGKEVSINGDVIEVLSVPFVSQGAYKLDDGTGSIWIVTSSGTPGKGKTVSVKGSVRTAFKLGITNLGTIVFEQSRR